MAMPWIQNVRDSHQLSYGLTVGIASAWTPAITWGISEFNQLSSRHSFGVTFIPVTDSDESNLQIATASGQIAFAFGGSDMARNLPGDALQGQTVLLGYEGTGYEKALMYLPNQPMTWPIDGPRRAAGPEILKMIVLHELIHVTGLSNADHTSGDVFDGHPSIMATGQASTDRLQVQHNGEYRFMPPVVFSTETVRKISGLWT